LCKSIIELFISRPRSFREKLEVKIMLAVATDEMHGANCDFCQFTRLALVT
jgi:hypothetical protein